MDSTKACTLRQELHPMLFLAPCLRNGILDLVPGDLNGSVGVLSSVDLTEGHCICKNRTSPEMTIHVTDEKDPQKTTETVDARIVDEQTRIRITHCIKESTPDTAEVDCLKKELSDTKEELEKLKLNQKSKDQMLTNQTEMLKVQQDTLNITQAELKETQERLKELENMKKTADNLAKELESKQEAEKVLKEALSKAEKRNEEQQVTIKNLQEALLSTKHQLEELQGKGTAEVSVNTGRTWGWLQTSRSNHATKTVVHDV